MNEIKERLLRELRALSAAFAELREPELAAKADAIREKVREGAFYVAMCGHFSAGKSSLINALCGARAKTSNFPGTTTTMRTGRAELQGIRVDVTDLPGVYDLRYTSPEVRIAQDVLAGTHAPAPDVVVVIVDACNLTRNLVLVGELLASGQRLVVAMNMVDIAQRR